MFGLFKRKKKWWQLDDLEMDEINLDKDFEDKLKKLKQQEEAIINQAKDFSHFANKTTKEVKQIKKQITNL